MKTSAKRTPPVNRFLVHVGEKLAQRSADLWARLYSGAPEIEEQHRQTVVFLRIRNRTGRMQRFFPNAAQKQYAAQRTSRNIILKARQLGMTTYIAARLMIATILRPGTVTLQVAHSLESAQNIFRIVHRFARQLDRDVLPRSIVTATTKPRMTMVSGIATRMITVPLSSGFSASVAAPAAPILDCAHAVAMADTASTSAAPPNSDGHSSRPGSRVV